MTASTEETPRERSQRNFNELLQELRVAQTGVQILFAFLLTLVFTPRFAAVGTFDRTVYLVALLSAAAATAMIIAPVAHHRVLFQQGEKPRLVRSAHRMASGGLAFLVVAMASSVTLATDIVLDRPLAVTIGLATGLGFTLVWVVPPMRHRLRDDDGSPDA